MSHCFPLMIQSRFRPTYFNYSCQVNSEINSLYIIGWHTYILWFKDTKGAMENTIQLCSFKAWKESFNTGGFLDALSSQQYFHKIFIRQGIRDKNNLLYNREQWGQSKCLLGTWCFQLKAVFVQCTVRTRQDSCIQIDMQCHIYILMFMMIKNDVSSEKGPKIKLMQIYGGYLAWWKAYM